MLHRRSLKTRIPSIIYIRYGDDNQSRYIHSLSIQKRVAYLQSNVSFFFFFFYKERCVDLHCTPIIGLSNFLFFRKKDTLQLIREINNKLKLQKKRNRTNRRIE